MWLLYVGYRKGGMTEVTTDRNDRPVAVGGIGNYAAAQLVVSTETDRELLLRK